MLLVMGKGLVAANRGFEGICQRVVAAVFGNGCDVSGIWRGVVDLHRGRNAARQQPVGQRADLLRLLAGPCFKSPDGDLGLRKDMGDVLDDVAPAARLGGEPVEHLRSGQRAACLGPKGQCGGPMGFIRADRQPDAQGLAAKGGGKTCQPVGGLRVKLTLAEALRQGAEDIFLADDQPVIAVQGRARHFHLDAAQRALPGGAVPRRQAAGVADQPGEQPRARAPRPPESGAVLQEGLAVCVQKHLQGGGPRAMRAQMQTNIHVLEPLT